jgi:DNA-binding NtrC family response regulator
MNQTFPEANEESGESTTAEIRLIPRRVPWRVEVGNAIGHRTLTLRDGQSVVLGSGAGASFVLDDPAVSGEHCELQLCGEGLHVVDLRSKNGVYVGAARVPRATLTGLGGSFVVGCTTVTARPLVERDGSTCEVPGLIGRSEPMQRVKRLIARYASLRAPVLIVGESGTGKDVVARALHRLGSRAGEYVPLNVAALPDSLLDGELFGHRRGAFTGAVAHRAGAFEQANRGTLFLDEIAEMSAAAQARLLRVVEDGQLRPVGSEQAMAVDVRVISATWADLPRRVEEGGFREDLYHRLSTLIIELPPLRQRRTDIPALASSLLSRIESDVGRKELSPATLARLVAHSWPGNVRQLFGTLYRSAAQCEGDTIEPCHLELPEQEPERRPSKLTLELAGELLAEHGSISAAARAAGVPRTTFRSLLERSGRLGAAPAGSLGSEGEGTQAR